MNLAFKLAQMDPSLPRLPGSLHVNRQLGQWLKFHADGHVSVYSGKVEIGQGIITALYLMDPTDKQWDANADMKTWSAWMDKWMPGANKSDGSYVFAYAVSYLMEQTLKQCGDNLTRENLMRQAANSKKLRVPLLLPGITINTSPTDFYPVQSVQLASFKGETWNLFGDIMSAEST